MTRSKRMEPVQRAVGHAERDCAARLGEADRRLADAQTRLAELEAYHGDYASGLAGKVRLGMSATGLRDYQAFLARLAEAVDAQVRIVAHARAERDGAQSAWSAAAQRTKAIGQVVERWQGEERAASDRHEQKETDERALRINARTRG